MKIWDLGVTGHERAASVGEARAAFAFACFHLKWLFMCTGICRGSIFGLPLAGSSCATVPSLTLEYIVARQVTILDHFSLN